MEDFVKKDDLNSDKENKVVQLKNKLKNQFLHENPSFKNDKFLDIVFNQAIFESMKRVYDNEMKKTEKSMEKTFWNDTLLKDSTYDKEKQKKKRELKNIEYYRNAEGKKLEKLSEIFPDELKQLKNEHDETKNNFVSNHYNISKQNATEILAFENLRIYKKILKGQIKSEKKVLNYEFEDMYKEYDDYFTERINIVSNPKTSADKYLYVLIDLFNFEDNVSLELVYSIADYVVNNDINDEVFERVKWLYVSHVLSPNGVYCMNRSFFLKKEYMPILLKCEEIEFAKQLINFVSYTELVYVLKTFLIKDEMIIEISKNEWVEFLKENYDVLSEFNGDKIWNSKKIKIARKIFDKWSGQDVC